LTPQACQIGHREWEAVFSCVFKKFVSDSSRARHYADSRNNVSAKHEVESDGDSLSRVKDDGVLRCSQVCLHRHSSRPRAQPVRPPYIPTSTLLNCSAAGESLMISLEVIAHVNSKPSSHAQTRSIDKNSFSTSVHTQSLSHTS
jgi:hypothetical protein